MADATHWDRRKVVIIGAGAVGSTFAFALAQSGLADEIALIDKNSELAKGQVLDLGHGLPFFPSVRIYEGTSEDYANAQAIVMTAGAKQLPGESRIDLLQRNASIVEGVVDDIVGRDSQGVVVVVSNPVDVLTYVALKRAGWERGRIIGSGTVLDSARLRYLLSECSGIDVHNVHAYVLGEHGDSEFAAWSLGHIAGMESDEYCTVCGQCEDWSAKRPAIEDEVRNSAYHIIDYKGSTYFAIGLALVRIVEAILRGERSVLTVSTLLEGEYGISDVCLSVPCVLSANGIERIIEANLPPGEMESLVHSADVLREALGSLKGSGGDGS